MGAGGGGDEERGQGTQDKVRANARRLTFGWDGHSGWTNEVKSEDRGEEQRALLGHAGACSPDAHGRWRRRSAS